MTEPEIEAALTVKRNKSMAVQQGYGPVHGPNPGWTDQYRDQPYEPPNLQSTTTNKKTTNNNYYEQLAGKQQANLVTHQNPQTAQDLANLINNAFAQQQFHNCNG